VVKTISWTNLKAAIKTAVEAYSTYFNVTSDTSDAITQGSTNLFLTSAERTKLTNTSGTNTGDQDLSGYQLQPSEGAFVDGDKTKLDGIEAGAEVNVNADWNAVSGDAQILNKPTIPTNNNELTNGAGYITDYTVTEGDVTAHEAALSITESQISDLKNYGIKAVANGSLTAVLDTYYVCVSNSTFTDPSPVEGEGFAVFVRNGTATVGGTGYSTAGTIIHRVFHSGAWANYVYGVSGTFATAAQGSLADSAVQPGDTATTSAVGVVELATTAEVNTGTDTSRATTPDAIAGSYAGTKSVAIQLTAAGTDCTTGDGKAYFMVPAELAGMNIIDVKAGLATAGTTGTHDLQIHNVTDSVDVLSTKLTIDSGETTSETAATAAVINTANDDVAEGDILRIDCDAVATTAGQGDFITITFRLP